MIGQLKGRKDAHSLMNGRNNEIIIMKIWTQIKSKRKQHRINQF